MSYSWTKWTTWEYLPWWLANMPVYAFYAWFALRARHFFFFSNVNPTIPLGGAMGESKHAILQLLPAGNIPVTVFIPAASPFEEVQQQLEKAELHYPLIVKPDVGERGFLIRRVNNPAELQQHLEQYPAAFLVQKWVDLPLEFSVLFHRHPATGRFGITSICRKEFLKVTGDGRSTIALLMGMEARSAFQLPRLSADRPDLLARVPAKGEVVLVEPIGNHARGTKFLNANQLITPELTAAFDRLTAPLKGIHYGRFDLKTASLQALEQADVQILELNGILGEPAHVYDPAYGPFNAYRDLYQHWRLLYNLYQEQAAKGVQPTSHRLGVQLMRDYFKYKKKLNRS